MLANPVEWDDLIAGDIVRYQGKRLKFVARHSEWWHFRTTCGKPATVRWPDTITPEPLELLYRAP